MRDLPDRDSMEPAEWQAEAVDAYQRGELKTRNEMNEEAATEALSRLYAANSRADTVTAVLDAAWGVDDDVE